MAKKTILEIKQSIRKAIAQPRLNVPIKNVNAYELMRKCGWFGGKYKTYRKKPDTME